MELTILFACFVVAIALVHNGVIQKRFHETLILQCGCSNNQSCYSQINNNLNDTGSYITPDGYLFLPAGTWDVQGKVCCGPGLNQLQCWTVCSYNELCETCSLGLFTNASSVNGTIRTIQGKQTTFIANFANQEHNAITLKANESIQNPNFSCIGVPDSNKLTEALEVQYNCVAMEPGIYIVYAEVTFCNHLYLSEKNFIVIVENAATPASESTSSTSEIILSTSSTSESISSTSESISSTSESISTTFETIVPKSSASFTVESTSSMSESRSSQSMSTNHSISPSTSIGQPVSLPTSTPISSVTDRNSGQNADNNHVATIVIAVMCSLIFIAVVFLIVILSYKRCKVTQPPVEDNNDIDDFPMNQTQNDHEVVNRPISVCSNDSVDIDTVDYPTPARSSPTMSVGNQERNVLSEPSTQLPYDASTPHQTVETVKANPSGFYKSSYPGPYTAFLKTLASI